MSLPVYIRNGAREGQSYYGTVIELLCGLSIMALFPVTLSDPNYPKPPIFDVYIAFHIFVVGRDRGFKFGR